MSLQRKTKTPVKKPDKVLSWISQRVLHSSYLELGRVTCLFMTSLSEDYSPNSL